jgi:DNA-binding IclR family transcriptional regulator
VNFAVLQGDYLNYLMTLESTHALRFVGSNRRTDPLHCTALGRSILAHMGKDRQEYFLRGPLSKQTPFTIVDPKDLRKIFEDAKSRGYAFEENESDVGVACFGAPVFDRGEAVAAISVSVPTARVDNALRRKLTSAVRQAASQLTRALNETGAAPA